MTKNIISLLLLVISVSMSFKHGWDTFSHNDNPESVKMMNELGISASAIPFFVGFAFAVGVLLMIPGTYFLGNLLNAMSIIFVMALALRAGSFKIALMEIPFLVIPLVMIWLKYPFKNQLT